MRDLRIPLLAAVFLLAASAPMPAAARPPAATGPRGDLRVVVFGDFHGPYGAVTYPAAVARTVAAIVDDWRPDLVLLPGDLIAGQSRSLPDERFAEMWAAFDAAVAAPLRRAGIPYAATLGNHDASKLRDAGGAYAFARERDAAAAYWSAPHHRDGLAVVDGAAYPFAWSLRLGPLFVAVIDASGPWLYDAELAALEATLADPAARDATLRWVMGHLPPVGIAEGRDRPGEVLARTDRLLEVLAAGRVDTFVAGHQAVAYAGVWQGLELMYAGGVGARRILGGGPPRSAVAVVDVDLAEGRVRVRFFDPASLEPLPDDAFPARVDGFGGTLLRSERLRPRTRGGPTSWRGRHTVQASGSHVPVARAT